MPPRDWGGVIRSFYFLLYTPFYTYHTISTLSAIYSESSCFIGIESWMVSLAYIMMFWTLALGILAGALLGVFIALILVVGVIGGLLALILRVFCPTYFKSLMTSLTQPAPYPPLSDPFENQMLQQPLIIQLVGERFDPAKYDQKFIEEEVCSICLGNYEAEQIVTHWPQCKHLFHKGCLEYWIVKNSTCPICKTHYPSSLPVGGSQNGSMADVGVDSEFYGNANAEPNLEVQVN